MLDPAPDPTPDAPSEVADVPPESDGSEVNASDANAIDTGLDATDTKIASTLAWPDAPNDGWNVTTTAVTGMKRVPIYGLSSVGASKAPMPAAEESADARAIAYVPDGLDATQPVEVLLHFHGFGVGWRQHTAAASIATTDLQTRYVSDVRDYTLAEQLVTSGRTIVALLPQGNANSGFTPSSGAFDCDAFVAEALAALVSGGLLSQLPVVSRTIVSAHSGGGGFLLGLESAAGTPHLPASQEALFLFDAVNGLPGRGSREAGVHANFLTSRLARDFAAIAAATSDDDKLAAASASFRFYGAYSQSDYATWYAPVKTAVDGWFATHAAQLGGPSSAPYTALRANYVVTGVSGVPHPEMVGHGNLSSALGTLA